MFAQIPLEALTDDRLNRADMRVLASLFSFASIQDPICWPSRAAIAARCGIRSLPLISQALSRLSRFGWITGITRRRGSSLYTLRVPSGTCSPRGEQLDVHPVVDTEQNTGTDQLPPSPQGEESLIEVEEVKIDGDQSGDQSGHQPEPEIPEITALIAYFYAISGTKADSARHRKALSKALKTNTPDEIKRAAQVAKASWSNPAWITPAAICKPGRVDELLSQSKAAQAPRAAAHKLFEREPAPKPSARKAAAAGLAGLRAALAA